MRIKFLLLRFFFVNILALLMAGSMLAQQTKVTGTVIDSKTSVGMPGASVVLKGTQKATVTDMDGKYSITVDDVNGSLVISFLGYIAQEVAIGGRAVVDVTLVEDITKMDEVVVVGYGTQKKNDVTGAVSIVNTENMRKVASNNISKSLQGQTSGVQVFGGGEPGAVQKVQIRGIGTFGNTEPLYVVDGVPIAGATFMGGAGALNFENNASGYGSGAPSGGISDFNPNDIESVQILKDASAAAIYGARGANGVIIITTKRGKEGTMKVEYSGSYGTQDIAKRLDFTNRKQYQELNNESRLNDGQLKAEANDDTSKYYIGNIDTDWQKETFKTGYITDHSLSVQGGTENSRYFGSMGYSDQTGTVVGNGPRYKKYTGQVSLDQKKGRLRFSESFTYTHSEQIRLTSQRWTNYITDFMMSIPTVPIYDTANIGGYGGSNQYYGVTAGNPIAFNSLPEVTFSRNRFLGVVTGELEILQGFSYKINLSYDRSDWHNKEFLPIYFVGDKFTNSVAKLSEWRGETPIMIMEHLLNFKKTIGDHDFAALAGYTAQKDWSEELYGHKEGYTDPYLKQISSSSANAAALGVRNEHAMISYLGRVNYNYTDRYLLTASIRRDYSSNFGPQNKHGDFPSFALGWKVSNEEFFKSNVSFINLLKLRGGWGKIGNEAIGAYQYETAANNAATYFFGGVLLPGKVQTTFTDPSIKWEERVTTDVGFDMAMLQNKVELSAEYYKNEAKDILIPYPLPCSSGINGWSIPSANGASMINKGFEVSLSYKKFEGDFHYQISGNITTINNEVTKIGMDNTPIIGTASITKVGRSMGEIYVYKTEGIFQDSIEINIVAPGETKVRRNDDGTRDTITFDAAKHAFQTNKTQAGDVKFVDMNGDSIIDEDDRTYLGSAIPKFTYGLNLNFDYKGFDLSIFFQGIYGNKVFNQPYRVLSSLGKAESNYTVESYENRWTPSNRSNTWPRASVLDNNDNIKVSDRFVQDGSYFRLQNVVLGYTLPKNMSSKFGIESLRIYVQGQNLWTKTDLWGYDPDFINDGTYNRGFNNGSYPTPRSFLVGVKIGL